MLGPAGTGKTESVKALGHQLGRFVLVFNCDETFDFQVRDTFTVYSEILSPNLALLDLISVYFNYHRLFSRPWVVSLSVCAKWVHGAALTSSTVWKKECCQLFRNRFRPFSSLSEKAALIYVRKEINK